MTEYTPSTEEVRDVYQCRLIKLESNIYSLIDEAQANAEFDRWLAEVKADAFDIGAASQRNAYARNIYREGNK